MNLIDEDKQWIKENVEAPVREQLERVETALLTAFHQWASPQEMRQRTHTAASKALDAEMEYLCDRVTKLEGSK
jgi:hypothetical protein